jgi:hypothetical protein
MYDDYWLCSFSFSMSYPDALTCGESPRHVRTPLVAEFVVLAEAAVKDATRDQLT